MGKKLRKYILGGLDTELSVSPNDPGAGQSHHLFCAINHVAHYCHNVAPSQSRTVAMSFVCCQPVSQAVFKCYIRYLSLGL